MTQPDEIVVNMRIKAGINGRSERAYLQVGGV